MVTTVNHYCNMPSQSMQLDIVQENDVESLPSKFGKESLGQAYGCGIGKLCCFFTEKKRRRQPFTQNHYLNEPLSSLHVDRLLQGAVEALINVRIHSSGPTCQYVHRCVAPSGLSVDCAMTSRRLNSKTAKRSESTH